MPLAITKPTLLIDKDKTIANIRAMTARAQQGSVAFRPHFKTHQSAEIGSWFRAAGVSAITVSSVDMALYFAAAGWDDILIAFPVNGLQSAELNQLAEAVNLHLLVESAGAAVSVSNFIRHDVNIWLKIDAGSGRTGLLWHDAAAIGVMAETVAAAPHLQLLGILTHAGHTYSAGSVNEITAIYATTVARMNQVRQDLGHDDHQLLVSVGDTPACSLVDSFGEVDEIRPGNFVFYDLTQHALNTCLPDNISVAVACPIVAKHDNDQRIILYGGAVHLSKDSLSVHSERIYGRIAKVSDAGWGQMIYGSKLVSISQEHGVLRTDRTTYESLHVGDIVAVLPVHSCLTADLYGQYATMSGNIITKMRTNA